MQPSSWSRPLLCLAVVWALLVLAQPAAAGEEPKVEKEVRVKVIKCESGECEEMTEDVVGEAGDRKVVVRKIHCEGGDCEEHGGVHQMVFVGDDGQVEVVSGPGHYAWVNRHGDMVAGGGYLGVGLTELTPELRRHFGVPADAGVMVSKVMDDSPAFRAGLEAGDIIAGVDGESIANGSALGKTIRSRDDGEEVVLDVWRDGAVRQISATVEERDGGLHAAHMGDMHKRVRKIVIECDDDEADCGTAAKVADLDEFDCGGADECEVEVECKDGSCTCQVNGEAADCAGIPGVPGS